MSDKSIESYLRKKQEIESNHEKASIALEIAVSAEMFLRNEGKKSALDYLEFEIEAANSKRDRCNAELDELDKTYADLLNKK